MKFNISEYASEKVGQHIVISGCARSGTTIVSKLLHTYSNVELNFEPPMMFSLLPLIKDLPAAHWKLLYETYLYEDFFIDALCGRRINCNRGDDSSVWNVKSEDEIKARLSESVRKVDSEVLGAQSHIAYKIPDATPFLKDLKALYPQSRIIIVRRDAVGTLSSVIEKGWFNEKNEQSNLIWPFTHYSGVKVPYFVTEDDIDLWAGMNEMDRCAYYYIKVNSSADEIPERIDIKYSSLLANPSLVASDLAKQLGLSFGCRTQEVIDSIKPTIKQRETELFDNIRPDLRELVEYYSERSC